MFDLQIQRTKEKLIQAINESQLPISVIDLILRDLQIEVSQKTQIAIKQQLEAEKAQIEKEKKENESKEQKQ